LSTIAIPPLNTATTLHRS